MERWEPTIADARQSLSAVLDQAADVWDQVNDATDGKLWMIALTVAMFMAVLATPAPKGAEPALAAARALSAMMVAVLAVAVFIPR